MAGPDQMEGLDVNTSGISKPKLGAVHWEVSAPEKNALKLPLIVNKSTKQVFAWTLVPSLQFNGSPHFKTQPLGPTLQVGTFTVSWQTSGQEMQDSRSVLYQSQFTSSPWARATDTRSQANDDFSLWKVCWCEGGKARSMALEMSRCRTARLSFQVTWTAGKRRPVLGFPLLFTYLNSWVKITAKIQLTLHASSPLIQWCTGSHVLPLLFFLALCVTSCTISSMVTPAWNQRKNSSVGYSFTITSEQWGTLLADRASGSKVLL